MCRQNVVYRSYANFLKYNAKYRQRNLFRVASVDKKQQVCHQQIINHFCLSQYLMKCHKHKVRSNLNKSVFVLSGTMNYALLPFFLKISINGAKRLNRSLDGCRFFNIRQNLTNSLAKCKMRCCYAESALVRILIYNVHQQCFECCYFTDFTDTKQMLELMLYSSTYVPTYVSSTIPELSCAIVLDSAWLPVHNDPAFEKHRCYRRNWLMRLYVQPIMMDMRKRTVIEATLQTILSKCIGTTYADVLLTRVQDLSWSTYDEAWMEQRFVQLQKCASFFDKIITSLEYEYDQSASDVDHTSENNSRCAKSSSRPTRAGELLRAATCDAIKTEMCSALRGAVQAAVREAICELICKNHESSGGGDDPCCDTGDTHNSATSCDGSPDSGCRVPTERRIPLPKGWRFQFGGKYMHLMKDCQVIQSWCI